jgi:hypothetical protein
MAPGVCPSCNGVKLDVSKEFCPACEKRELKWGEKTVSGEECRVIVDMVEGQLSGSGRFQWKVAWKIGLLAAAIGGAADLLIGCNVREGLKARAAAMEARFTRSLAEMERKVNETLGRVEGEMRRNISNRLEEPKAKVLMEEVVSNRTEEIFLSEIKPKVEAFGEMTKAELEKLKTAVRDGQRNLYSRMTAQSISSADTNRFFWRKMPGGGLQAAMVLKSVPIRGSLHGWVDRGARQGSQVTLPAPVPTVGNVAYLSFVGDFWEWYKFHDMTFHLSYVEDDQETNTVERVEFAGEGKGAVLQDGRVRVFLAY